MPSVAVMRTLVRELMTSERAPRVTEPDLVMSDPEQVEAYTRAGRVDGVMAPVYLFHAYQICDVVKAGDTVVDLACGPATQLALVASLMPDVNFIGVDLSREMLKRAHEYIAELGLTNVEFRYGSITQLDSFEDLSIDVVMSTMALHHLPDSSSLCEVFSEVKRIIKPDAGLYLVDFGHLKSMKSIESFGYQYADRQPKLFTEDYLNSLHAAFSVNDFRQAVSCLEGRGALYTTFVAPYMIAFKSQARGGVENKVQASLSSLKSNLPSYHKVDFKDLCTFFSLGGLKSKYIK